MWESWRCIANSAGYFRSTAQPPAGSGARWSTWTGLCRTTAGKRCHTSGCRSEEHTSELQSQSKIVCRLLLEKKKKKINEVVGATKSKIVDKTRTALLTSITDS